MKSYINAISAVVAVVVLFAGNGFAQGTYYMHRPLTVKGQVKSDSLTASTSQSAFQYPGRFGNAPVFGYTDANGSWGNGLPFCGVAGVAGAGTGEFAIGTAGIAGTNANPTNASIGCFGWTVSNGLKNYGLLAQAGFGNTMYPGGTWAGVFIGSVYMHNDLQINGKLKIKNWSIEAPDYVFEKSYMLKPISELSRFIADNKHLPDVPSAKEMKKHGVDMAEMDMILLRKVEELTLYIIEQNKKIETLEKQMVNE